jgi:hypothetical protein
MFTLYSVPFRIYVLISLLDSFSRASLPPPPPMASSAPLGVTPGPTHLPWPEDTNLDMAGSWIWNWQPSEIQKVCWNLVSG